MTEPWYPNRQKWIIYEDPKVDKDGKPLPPLMRYNGVSSLSPESWVIGVDENGIFNGTWFHYGAPDCTCPHIHPKP